MLAPAATTPVGEAAPAASLAQVLEARDHRARCHVRLLAAGYGPVLSLTLVSPGAVKDSPGRRLLMDAMEEAFAAAFRSARIHVPTRLRLDGPAGPESFWVAEASPRQVKRIAVEIEHGMPWGRLLDADVLIAGPRGEPLPLARTAFGWKARPCLVCGKEAKECIGLRRHLPHEAETRTAAMILGLAGRP